MFENHSETFDCRLCTPRLRFEPKERKPGEKRKVRSLRPKLEPLAESISAIKSPKKALTTSSKLFVAAPTLKAEDVFKTMGNQQRKVTHSEFEGASFFFLALFSDTHLSQVSHQQTSRTRFRAHGLAWKLHRLMLLIRSWGLSTQKTLVSRMPNFSKRFSAADSVTE